MIHLMLNDLRRKASVGFHMRLQFQGTILHFDGLVALAGTRAAEKRQTAFLGVVRSVLLDDFRVEHHGIGWSSSALVKKRNDPLAHADHICRHADTAFSMGNQCVQ